ncbi:hypothetical protein ACFFMN_08170 [Planobispora siamensis]|uniref:Uncharacterized protein n=1 Tax=Planobispora siamensis TaxID=936338 RepID=A0A8J3WJ94_9ACTN|nr:hypothetical protein [Planobispora siamensis]GIH90467.1 hypothetical protein Psi01_10970 [Planobispora siamensis]
MKPSHTGPRRGAGIALTLVATSLLAACSPAASSTAPSRDTAAPSATPPAPAAAAPSGTPGAVTARASEPAGLCDPRRRPAAGQAVPSDDPGPEPSSRGGNVIDGLHVGYVPEGFSWSESPAPQSYGEVWEYGRSWSDDRDDADERHRFLWIRVVCWDALRDLDRLRGLPVPLGRFSGDVTTESLAGRRVLAMDGDGALGRGRLVGWIERPGVAVTVLASEPLLPRLAEIVEGVEPS